MKLELNLSQDQVRQLKSALILKESREDLHKDPKYQDILIQVFEKGVDEEDAD